MQRDDSEYPNLGDLLFMECLPGGPCLYLGKYRGIGNQLYFTVYHGSSQTIMKLPDYHFIDIELAKDCGY